MRVVIMPGVKKPGKFRKVYMVSSGQSTMAVQGRGGGDLTTKELLSFMLKSLELFLSIMG